MISQQLKELQKTVLDICGELVFLRTEAAQPKVGSNVEKNCHEDELYQFIADGLELEKRLWAIVNVPLFFFFPTFLFFIFLFVHFFHSSFLCIRVARPLSC